MPRRLTPDRQTFDKNYLLGKHPIFSVLGREALDRLCAHAIRRSVKRGATIFAKGDPGSSLFAVCSGTVKITAQSAGGREALFNLITEGAIFGEVSLLDGHPRTADATAITDCELMVIERRDFESLIYERPQIAFKLFEVLCGRLRHTTEQLEDLMFLDLQARLAKTLLRLAVDLPDGMIVLTQRDISKIVGISRESANKKLRLWAKNKWLLLKHGGIKILAPQALAAIASTISDDKDD